MRRRKSLDLGPQFQRINSAVLKLVLQITRGLLRDQAARRSVMFYTVLAALVMLFLGVSLLWGWLRSHLLLFLLYWGVCAWITLTATLLAIFDMLLVRAAARRARRRLEAEYLADTREEGRHDPDAR